MHGADVNCEDRWGNRPLRDAKSGGHQEVSLNPKPKP